MSGMVLGSGLVSHRLNKSGCGRGIQGNSRHVDEISIGNIYYIQIGVVHHVLQILVGERNRCHVAVAMLLSSQVLFGRRDVMLPLFY